MEPMNRTAALLLCASFLVISACAPYGGSMAGVSVDMPGSFSEGSADAAADIGRWWERFGDERLNALVEEALRGNLDIAQAYERLRQAQAVARTAGASRSPALDVEGSAGWAGQLGAADNSFKLSAAARYEIDLWRKLGSGTQAERLSALASREDVKALYISVSAQLADLYYLALEQRAQLQLTERTIGAFQDGLARVERRYRAGLVSALDVYQARQNLALARARRPVFEANLAAATNAIYALMGRFPEKEAGRITGELPLAPEFPAGIPSQLLARRPDINAALLRLEAGDRRTAAAIADRFPSFNLVGQYGGASAELKDILDSPNIIWNLLIQIAQPILDGGRRKAEVERTRAAFRESLALYQQTVIEAFNEVEDAISGSRASEQRIRMLREKVAASENETRLSLERYSQGLSDYLPVLTAQQRLFDSKSALLAARRQLLSGRIQLARALGGDWAEDVLQQRAAAEDSGKEDGK